ncbi:hypothetical protein M413DRAFT_304153 [Hebeloma cylindrosporum]|uniref:Uncharacterized protein n=1 Tax=Hebeloma cylindrosporum TaxID=76867 RepID=A0A0C3CQK4_HEBCY|nr:hypothetical protein M413DRAFT_304153 [Hebeloma cylindrosporum h7]
MSASPSQRQNSLRNLGEPSKARSNGTPRSRPIENDNSPASTLSESPPANAFSLNISSNILRNIPVLKPSRLLVRSDPSILTCFDPSDKELYELWAPKT